MADSIIDALHTYAGSLSAIYLFATLISLSITQMFLETERQIRKSKGYEKPPWWRLTLKAVSTLSGLASAPFGRLAVMELPRVAAEGTELEPLEHVLPSVYITCFVGFLAGFFLTMSVAWWKNRLRSVAPSVAEKIPNLGGTTLEFPAQSEPREKTTVKVSEHSMLTESFKNDKPNKESEP